MATAKQQQLQPAPRTPIVLAVTVVATAIAAYHRFPVAIVVLVGVMIAGLVSQPPILTGPKDHTGSPTVGNPGEQQALNRHQFWRSLPRSFFTIGKPWPITFSQLGALGVACMVYTLPYVGALPLLRELDAVDAAPALPAVNAVAAFLLVAGIATALRRRSPENGEQPATTVQAMAQELRAGAAIPYLAAAIIGGGTAAGITLWWLTRAGWGFLQPAPLFAGGMFLAVAAALGHQAVAQKSRKQWRDMAEARSVWAERFALVPAVKIPPTLVSHRRLGAHEEVWIDEFAADVSQGAAWWNAKPLPEVLAPVIPPHTLVAFLGALDTDREGNPIVPSRSAKHFTVMSWSSDHLPNVLDPTTDPEVLGAWFEMQINATCVAKWGAQFSLIPAGLPVPQHEVKDQYAEGETAAWAWEVLTAEKGTNLVGSMPDLALGAKLALGGDIEVYPKGTTFYIGAVTADTTTLQDDTLVRELQEEEMRSVWKTRWMDITGQGLQAPTYFPEFDGEAKLADGKTIFSRLFLAPQGLSSTDYFVKATPERLQSGLPNAQWSNLSYFTDTYSNRRYTNSLHVFWSEDQIPLNPARISPKGEKQANQWAITGAVNTAFHAAKLPRPEVVSVKPLTSPDSRSHIWEVHLVLYGGVTFAEVRKNQERLRNALEGCEWLRVGESPRGCRIVCGAPPTSKISVTWGSAEAQANAMSLEWEQAFHDSKVKNASEQTPKLVSVESLPKNDLVKRYVFQLPPGLGVADVQKHRGTLAATTGNAFLDIRPAPEAGQLVVLAAELSPMPDVARFDWGEVAAASKIPFATNIQGEPVYFDPLVDPHFVVLGAPGSGKSALLQAILAPAAVQGYEIHLFDKPKGAADFQFLVPYASSVATEYATIAEGLERIYVEVQRRKELNRAHAVSRVSELPEGVRPRHVLVMIDEFTSTIKPELIDRATGTETEEQLAERAILQRTNEYKAKIGAAVGKIIREARSAGVTMLIAGQTLTAEEMKKSPALGNIKNQAAVTLLGKASYGQRASAFKNVELAPELGEFVPKGRGIFESAEGAPIMYQAWYGGDVGDRSPEALQRAAAEHLRDMTEHIAAVREPEAVQVGDDDLRPVESAVQVFGQVIGGAAPSSDDGVVDLGEIDLGDLDLEVDAAVIDTAATVAEAVTIDAADADTSTDTTAADATATDPVAPQVSFDSPTYRRPTIDDLF